MKNLQAFSLSVIHKKRWKHFMEPCNSTRSKWSLVQGFLYTKQEGNMKVRYGDADVDDHILENMVITSVFFRSILAPLTVFFFAKFQQEKNAGHDEGCWLSSSTETWINFPKQNPERFEIP